MEYSYFSPAPQPYQFIGLAPTPFSHPGETTSVHSAELDPTFMPYDTFNHFAHPGHGALLQQPAGSPHIAARATLTVGSVDSGIGGDMDVERVSRTRGSSEEKDAGLTPAQSRRKAQNRAAQRAFRERKERHVRDLEAKLSALETSTHTLQSDNERLKLALKRAETENEILRATTRANRLPMSSPGSSPGGSPRSPHFPLGSPAYLNEKDPYTTQYGGGGAKSALLPARATWDFIMSHPLVQQGLVDVADVCERLKGLAKCDGSGPVFEERDVWRAIEEGRRAGGDKLI